MADDDLMIEDDFQNIDTAPPKPKRTAKDVAKATLKDMKDRTTRVILEESEEIPLIGLFVGVNGRGYLIKPGMEVDLPQPVLHVLNNAVQSTPIVDPDTKQVTGWRERMRYPYRLVTGETA